MLRIRPWLSTPSFRLHLLVLARKREPGELTRPRLVEESERTQNGGGKPRRGMEELSSGLRPAENTSIGTAPDGVNLPEPGSG